VEHEKNKKKYIYIKYIRLVKKFKTPTYKEQRIETHLNVSSEQNWNQNIAYDS